MKYLWLAAIAAALLGPGAAEANCNLGTLDVPVKMDGLRPLVSAKLEGQPVTLVLDSGAFFSYLDASEAARLKLKPVTRTEIGTLVPSAGATVISGVAGRYVEGGVVTAASFEVGGAQVANAAFITGGGFRDAVGLLGQNVLHGMDDEYDLKDGVVRLVKPQGCEDVPLAYWAKAPMTYSMAPLVDTGRDLHTTIMVEVNGETMRATLDTGAPTTFITARAAARAGVRTTDPGVTAAGVTHGVDHAPVKTWVARFASVKIGDEEIKNTKLSIGETQAADFDVLLGADFFLAHHVYVANSQGKLYFTYSGGPVFRAVAAGETAREGGK
jgi:predicted aspartyl protease